MLVERRTPSSADFVILGEVRSPKDDLTQSKDPCQHQPTVVLKMSALK